MTLDDLYEERCVLLEDAGYSAEEVRTLTSTTEQELSELMKRLRNP